MLVGRPPKFSSPEQMQVLIDDYFKACDRKKNPYTVPGLALALGFESRFSIRDYEEKEEFTHTIKKAKLRIEKQRVDWLIQGKGSTAGQIFDLKNNFGWRDVQEIEHSGKGGPIDMTSLEVAARIATILELGRKRKEQLALENQEKKIPAEVSDARLE